MNPQIPTPTNISHSFTPFNQLMKYSQHTFHIPSAPLESEMGFSSTPQSPHAFQLPQDPINSFYDPLFDISLEELFR